METKKLFSERLRELLEERKISQRELAKRARISDAYISQLLMLKKTPTIKILKQISDALDVSPSYFLEEGRDVSIFLRKNKRLSEEDINAIEAFIELLIKKKDENKRTH
jgi:transcriptional regulator with XRE-family HTH domain